MCFFYIVINDIKCTRLENAMRRRIRDVFALLFILLTFLMQHGILFSSVAAVCKDGSPSFIIVDQVGALFSCTKQMHVTLVCNAISVIGIPYLYCIFMHISTCTYK